MRKWKILTFVFMFLFIVAAFYGVVFTQSVIDRWENRTVEVSLLEPRLMVGRAQMAKVLQEHLGIKSWEEATVSYYGETFTVTIDTGNEVLTVSGRVTEYEQWEILTINGEEVGQ